MMDKCREEFESWAHKCNAVGKLKIDLSMTVNRNFYFCEITELMWQSWQASRAAIKVELPDSMYDVANDALDLVRERLDELGINHE